MRHHEVGDVMTSDVITIRPTTGYKDIVGVLSHYRIAALPVVDDDDHVLGVVTESDLIRSVGHQNDRTGTVDPAGAQGITAEQLMSSPAVAVRADVGIAVAARQMEQRKLHRLVVVDHEGRLVGIVAARDLLRPYLRDDATIAEEIRTEVLAETLWIDPVRVAIEVRDGVVSLRGQLDRRSTVELVGRLVRGVAGVVDVDNHLSFHYDDANDRIHPTRMPLPL